MCLSLWFVDFILLWFSALVATTVHFGAPRSSKTFFFIASFCMGSKKNISCFSLSGALVRCADELVLPVKYEVKWDFRNKISRYKFQVLYSFIEGIS